MGESLQRTFSFDDFRSAIAFVNRVAELAEQQQHHPDIMVRYNKVTLTVSTHDAGGITDKDRLSADVALQVATASVAQAKAEESIAALHLDRCRITAPFAGWRIASIRLAASGNVTAAIANGESPPSTASRTITGAIKWPVRKIEI